MAQWTTTYSGLVLALQDYVEDTSTIAPSSSSEGTFTTVTLHVRPGWNTVHLEFIGNSAARTDITTISSLAFFHSSKRSA